MVCSFALAHETLQQDLGGKGAKPYISKQFHVHHADLIIDATFQMVPFPWLGVEG